MQRHAQRLGEPACGRDPDPQPGEGPGPHADRDRGHVVPAVPALLQQPASAGSSSAECAGAPSSRSGSGGGVRTGSPVGGITHATVDGHRGVEPDQRHGSREARMASTQSLRPRRPRLPRRSPPTWESSSLRTTRSRLHLRDAARRGHSTKATASGVEVVATGARGPRRSSVSSRKRSTCDTGTRPPVQLPDRERRAGDRVASRRGARRRRGRTSSCPCRHRPRSAPRRRDAASPPTARAARSVACGDSLVKASLGHVREPSSPQPRQNRPSWSASPRRRRPAPAPAARAPAPASGSGSGTGSAPALAALAWQRLCAAAPAAP